MIETRVPLKPATPAFSYFGGKHRAAGKYPEPERDTIIEPFAGSDGYSHQCKGKTIMAKNGKKPPESSARAKIQASRKTRKKMQALRLNATLRNKGLISQSTRSKLMEPNVAGSNGESVTNWQVIHGECLDVMRGMDAASVDAIVTDPPYPYIKRGYGTWDETSWRELMDGVIAESRRLLKPSGSMVVILQPNSERIGRMRPWWYRFMADMAEQWNIVQDAWWWNHAAAPTAHCQRTRGLMRNSLKSCVWLGDPDCYRNQDAVLWEASDSMKAMKIGERAFRVNSPSGQSVNESRFAEILAERGGVTPFNVIPCARTSDGHGAGTPVALMDWWARYICPPGGTVLDPFGGRGTACIAALRNGMNSICIERDAEYVAGARERIEVEERKLFAMEKA